VNYAGLLQSALVALLRNKLRSILTVLGITIGIAAVICVVAIGKAGQARVEQQLNNLGDNFVWIEAGGRAVNGVGTDTHDTGSHSGPARSPSSAPRGRLPTLYTKIDKAERGKRAAEALAMVGLADRAQHFPSQMSGGQQQRVAVARALVNHPSILLADEPTGNLDSRTSVEIMEIFQNLNDKGLTVVLVTHEQDIAQFAKRVLVFRDGKIRKDDPVVGRPRASEILKTLPTLED